MPNAYDQLDDAIRAQDAAAVEALLAKHPGLARGPSGVTTPPLQVAVGVTGNRAIVELLIEHGANLEAVCRDTGATPLKYAIVYTRLELISLLVQHGAELDGNEQGENTPLQLARSLPQDELRGMGARGTAEGYREVERILRSLGAVQ